jgi:hypothetical protein
MTAWSSDELTRIAAADELQIAPRRGDGSLRNPVTIWVVREGGDIYIRSYRGAGGSWFRGVQQRREGRIWAGGVEKDVSFAEETNSAINDRIDAAYRAKYGRSPYVGAMVAPEARATTLELMPR